MGSSCLFQSSWALESQLKGVVPLMKGSVGLTFPATISDSLEIHESSHKDGKERKRLTESPLEPIQNTHSCPFNPPQPSGLTELSIDRMSIM